MKRKAAKEQDFLVKVFTKEVDRIFAQRKSKEKECKKLEIMIVQLQQKVARYLGMLGSLEKAEDRCKEQKRSIMQNKVKGRGLSKFLDLMDQMCALSREKKGLIAEMTREYENLEAFAERTILRYQKINRYAFEECENPEQNGMEDLNNG